MPKGRFNWYELMTTDVEAAKAFYGSVVGWTMQPFPGGNDYTLLNVGETGVGGIMALPKEARDAGAKPSWLGYIAVDDTDAAAKRVAAAGGTIHMPPGDIPGVGRFAMVADPQGAAFYLITPASRETPPAPPMGAPGRIGWRELYTSDWQAALAFYEEQFGFAKTDAMDMGPMGIYLLFTDDGGDASGGMMNSPMGQVAWLYYFNVEGIDSAMERVKAGGGQILMGPQEVPGGGWIAQGIDPQGAMFALLGPRG
jgi:predicted enzyme related to lactoylglutathione lyase